MDKIDLRTTKDKSYFTYYLTYEGKLIAKSRITKFDRCQYEIKVDGYYHGNLAQLEDWIYDTVLDRIAEKEMKQNRRAA